MAGRLARADWGFDFNNMLLGQSAFSKQGKE